MLFTEYKVHQAYFYVAVAITPYSGGWYSVLLFSLMYFWKCYLYNYRLCIAFTWGITRAHSLVLSWMFPSPKFCAFDANLVPIWFGDSLFVLHQSTGADSTTTTWVVVVGYKSHSSLLAHPCANWLRVWYHILPAATLFTGAWCWPVANRHAIVSGRDWCPYRIGELTAHYASNF